MNEFSQIQVPPSFVALFLAPGRSRPSMPASHIAERYEFCEDLAQLLTEPALAHLHDLGAQPEDVLQRMAQGLAGGAAGVDEAEARWVLTRLAELLNWPPLAPPA